MLKYKRVEKKPDGFGHVVNFNGIPRKFTDADLKPKTICPNLQNCFNCLGWLPVIVEGSSTHICVSACIGLGWIYIVKDLDGEAILEASQECKEA